MYTFEQYDDYYYSFIVCKDGTKIMQVDANWHQLKALVDLANLALAEFADPMSPDCAALSQHESTSQYRDSEDSAGLGAGPLELGSQPLLNQLLEDKQEPFRPRIRSLVNADHGRAGCTVEDCPTCTILETRHLLRTVEL